MPDPRKLKAGGDPAAVPPAVLAERVDLDLLDPAGADLIATDGEVWGPWTCTDPAPGHAPGHDPACPGCVESARLTREHIEMVRGHKRRPR